LVEAVDPKAPSIVTRLTDPNVVALLNLLVLIDRSFEVFVDFESNKHEVEARVLPALDLLQLLIFILHHVEGQLV